MDNKVVLILESSSKDISVTKENQNYILEGPFTQFGVENNNKRIYEENEFLPHLDYLKKKMDSGRLVGELDHPEKFEVSLSKASHIIENLDYDKDKRQIVGRIRLLNTPTGEVAKRLIDSGVNLSISSRAAGVVSEDKRVQIKKVFTYDLVADPGFQNAQLSRINESLNFGNKDVAVFDLNMNESQLDTIIQKENFSVGLINNQNDNNFIKENKFKSMDPKEFVTLEALTEYNNHINQKIDSLLQNVQDKDDKIEVLEQTISDYKDYLNYMTEKFNNNVDEFSDVLEYTEYMKDVYNNNSASLLNYVQYVAENVDENINYSKYVAKNVDNIIDYSGHQTKVIRELESYTGDYLAKELENVITESDNILGYAEYVAKLSDQGIAYSEHLAEELDISTKYSSYLKENVESLINYADYLKENVSDSIDYSENEIGKKLNQAINYSNMIAEELNKEKGLVDSGSYFGINENRDDTKILIDSSNNIGTKIDALIESVQKQKKDHIEAKSSFPYFNLLNEQNKRHFLTLPNDQKQKVITAVKKYQPLNENDFMQIWGKELDGKNRDEELKTSLLENMPNEYRDAWYNLNEDQQSVIFRQAKYHKLDNPYAIRNFWHTRNNLTPNAELTMLTESERVEFNEKNERLGYSNGYLENVKKSLVERNKRFGTLK